MNRLIKKTTEIYYGNNKKAKKHAKPAVSKPIAVTPAVAKPALVKPVEKKVEKILVTDLNKPAQQPIVKSPNPNQQIIINLANNKKGAPANNKKGVTPAVKNEKNVTVNKTVIVNPTPVQKKVDIALVAASKPTLNLNKTQILAYKKISGLAKSTIIFGVINLILLAAALAFAVLSLFEIKIPGLTSESTFAISVILTVTTLVSIIIAQAFTIIAGSKTMISSARSTEIAPLPVGINIPKMNVVFSIIIFLTIILSIVFALLAGGTSDWFEGISDPNLSVEPKIYLLTAGIFFALNILATLSLIIADAAARHSIKKYANASDKLKLSFEQPKLNSDEIKLNNEQPKFVFDEPKPVVVNTK